VDNIVQQLKIATEINNREEEGIKVGKKNA
jgi:hypothetical protein